MTAAVEIRLVESKRWRSLPFWAQAFVLVLVAHMRREGGVGAVELALPPNGIEGLATDLRMPADELARALTAAERQGYLRLDAERGVIVDMNPSSMMPSSTVTSTPGTLASAPPDRREGSAYSSSTDDVVRERPCHAPLDSHAVVSDRSPTVDSVPAAAPSSAAIRAKAYRIRKKLEQLRVETAQEAFAFANTTPNAANALDLVRACFSERSQAFANAPSLSDLSLSSKKKSERGAPKLPLDPDAMPAGWLDVARALRPELPAETIARSWRRFALAKTGTFTSWPEAQGRWEGWLEREHAPRTVAASSTPSVRTSIVEAPYHRSSRLARPDEEPDAPTTELRPIIRAVVNPDVAAAAARAARGEFGVFVPMAAGAPA